MKPKLKRYIAIDPGDSCGICHIVTYNGRMKGVWLYTYTMLETLDFLRIAQGDDVIMVCEDPNKIRAIFDRHRFNKSFLTQLKIAQNVGMNKQCAKIILDAGKLAGFEVWAIKPEKRKIDAKEFKLLTGLKKSSQHSRDATMLLIRSGLISADRIRNLK